MPLVYWVANKSGRKKKTPAIVHEKSNAKSQKMKWKKNHRLVSAMEGNYCYNGVEGIKTAGLSHLNLALLQEICSANVPLQYWSFLGCSFVHTATVRSNTWTFMDPRTCSWIFSNMPGFCCRHRKELLKVASLKVQYKTILSQQTNRSGTLVA